MVKCVRSGEIEKGRSIGEIKKRRNGKKEREKKKERL
jgi:hypothetical protein